MKSSLIRIALIAFHLVLFIPNLTSAESKTFIKEYIYQASEADSRISSRTLALREVKRLLLEELGVYLESETEVKNFQLTKDQITTITAGIVMTEIVDEKWDGRTYWLRAKIVADPREVVKAIDLLRKDRAKMKELEELRRRSDALAKENERLRKDLMVAKGKKRPQAKAAYDTTIKELTAIEWQEKGSSYLTSKQYKDAIDALSKAIELDPQDGFSYGYRGAAYDELGNTKQAMDDYTKAIKNLPLAVAWFTYALRGQVYARLGNYKQAMDDYDRAIGLYPDYAEVYCGRGFVYGVLGNNRQAMDDFEKAIRLNPSLPKAYHGRGTIYWALGNYKQAIDDFGRAIELNPKDPDSFQYYLGRGSVYNVLGNYKKAIDDFSRAIELNPKDETPYSARGFSHGRLGNYNLAIQDYDTAINLNPKDAEAYYRRGMMYGGLENYHRTIQDMEMAITLNPQNAHAYYLRGLAYGILGNGNQEIADMKIAARLGDTAAQDNLRKRGIEW